MSKIIKKENPRVIIEPESHYSDGFDRLYRKCETIKHDINRHVDDIGYVSIEYDTNIICSHCGRSWEIDDNGLPQCCTKAQEEFEELKNEKA